MPACGFVRLGVWGLVTVLTLWSLGGCTGQQGGGKEEEQASKEQSSAPTEVVYEAQPSGPAEVVEAFTEAMNARDVEGALALVDDKAVYGEPGGRQLYGKEEIRTFLEGLVAREVHFEFLGEPQVEGEQVTWQSRVRLNYPEDEFINNAETVVRNGKIVAYNRRP